MTSLDDDLALAHALADCADAITLARFGAADLHVEAKADLTPVTDADRACEDALRDMLARERPDDAVLGEERGGSIPSERGWIIDPIDGTKNYVRGVPTWASLIGLVDGGQVILGCVSAPALGRRWWAARGRGAHVCALGATRRIHVSGVGRIEDASLSYSSLTGWRDLGLLDNFLALNMDAWRARAFGDFYSYMLLAEGCVDIACEPELALHDMAALVPIVEEAGGRFTSLAGEDGPWGTNALATNGRLHSQVLSYLGA
ncbi:inositol monophosphatase family protein [Nanchangia anserum]|uniref:Histidinol-phosphatase n=1 Tax=Nanchangia anserum TaxID=2692125 RepID=A0A8I0KP73_9ACTO|nr:histidinol phosphatase [Nanchangia anserum]